MMFGNMNKEIGELKNLYPNIIEVEGEDNG